MAVEFIRLNTPLAWRAQGEGMAIGPALEAWNAVGKQWKTWSFGLVSACLQMGGQKAMCLHVLSCYAPTRAASKQPKKSSFII